LSYGVVLRTTDGGKTWKRLVAPPIEAENAKTSDPKRQGAVTRHDNSRASEKERNESSARTGAEPSSAPASTFLPRLTRMKFFSSEEGFAVGQGTDDQPSGVFV